METVHGSQKVYRKLSDRLNLDNIWIPGNDGAIPVASSYSTNPFLPLNSGDNGAGAPKTSVDNSKGRRSDREVWDNENARQESRTSRHSLPSARDGDSGRHRSQSKDSCESRGSRGPWKDSFHSCRDDSAPDETAVLRSGLERTSLEKPGDKAVPDPPRFERVYPRISDSPPVPPPRFNPQRPPRACDRQVLDCRQAEISKAPSGVRVESSGRLAPSVSAAGSQHISVAEVKFRIPFHDKPEPPRDRRQIAKEKDKDTMYAPQPYDASGPNNPAMMETVRLFKNAKERDWYENMSDLYAVVNSIEQLEKAYIRDCIVPKEYTAACSKLLVQFKSAFKLVKSDEFPTIDVFMERFRFNCPAAMDRIKEDSPITIRDDKGNTSKCIADIVALFITVMDKLRLQMKAVDEIQPEMRDLMDTINRLSIIPADFEGRISVSKWLNVMSGMNASDQFDDGQIRQMLFDLEAGYSGFLKLLHV